MAELARTVAQSAIASYARAWVDKDPNLILTVFTEDAIYHERVLKDPMRGHQAIRLYWQDKVVATQDRLDFQLLNLYVDGNTAIAEWEVWFDDLSQGMRKHMKEVAILQFRDTLIESLREYWSAEDVGPIPNASHGA
jgi:ketosteroid isomerase-like protein